MSAPPRRPRVAPASRRGATLLAWLIGAGTAGCSDGYSTDSAGSRTASDPQSAEQIVAELNRMNRASLTSSRWRFSLLEPCELTLKAQRPDGSAQVLRLALQHSDVQVKGNVDSDTHGVQVAYAGAPGLADERLFEAPRWTDAVEYATQFHALQRSCSSEDAATTG